MKRSFFEFNDKTINLINHKEILESDYIIISAINLLKVVDNNDFKTEIFSNLSSNKKI